MSDEAIHRRESPAGYHFYFSYLGNPFEWFCRYWLGWRPKYTPPGALIGSHLHVALEAYYSNGYSKSAMLAAFERSVVERKSEYEDGEKLNEHMKKGPILLGGWAAAHEVDESRYDIVELESPYEFRVGPDPGFDYTMRIDRICRRKLDGKYFVFDAKYTSYSIEAVQRQCEAEDQMTSYLWGARKAHPDWDFAAAVPDVLYNRSEVYRYDRSCEIRRTQLDFTNFELMLVGIIIEVSQKVRALEAGMYPWQMLFPWHGRMAGLFGSAYSAVYRSPIQPSVVPIGFVRDEWSAADDELRNRLLEVDYTKEVINCLSIARQ